MTIATFFSRFDMELHETDASSMEWVDHGVASNRSYVKVKDKSTIGAASEKAWSSPLAKEYKAQAIL